MQQDTQLSGGHLPSRDLLQIRLVRAPGMADLVVVQWPAKPSMISAAQYTDLVATATRLLAESSVRLAQIQAQQR